MQVVFGVWTHENIVVLEISEHDWRVSDMSHSAEDGMAILRFVESTAQGFEATEAKAPSLRRAFSSMEPAVEFLSTADEPHYVRA